MQKLADITEFLLALDLVPAEQLESWAEEPRMIPSGKRTGNGLVLYRQTYEAVISIEHYPHADKPIEWLLGNVAAWLLTHGDGSDDIPQPRTEVDVVDHQSAHVELVIEFEEDVYAVADPAGAITLHGERYRIEKADPDVAETGEVAA